MKRSDMERAALAVELGEIAAKLMRDAATLTRAASWLCGNRPDYSIGRIGGVLHRYASEHGQVFAEAVAPIAAKVKALSESGKDEQKIQANETRRIIRDAGDHGSVVFLPPRKPLPGNGHDHPDGAA